MGRLRDKSMEFEFEMHKGEMHWILGMMKTHNHYNKARPPFKYLGKTNGCDKLKEVFDVFTTRGKRFVCYSDHDRLVYCDDLGSRLMKKPDLVISGWADGGQWGSL